MKKQYMYSIIIPIYNVEPYLKQCIDSVLCQTYQNYEIILVDDGSPDSCGIICDEYSKKHNNIKAIHKKNGGLSDARNVGLEASIGEYIIFLDSDDFWVDKHFLENISVIISGKDLIIFNSAKYSKQEKLMQPRFKLTDDFNKKNIAEKMNYLIRYNIYKACAWDKVIKSSILKDNNILFPKGLKSEDMLWGANLLNYIENIDIYDNVVYAYRQRDLSISKTVSEKHIGDIIDQLKTNFENEFIYNYLAFEYIILLAFAHCGTSSQRKNIKQLDYLLNYDLSIKVSKVKKIYNLLGFNITTKLLHMYIIVKGVLK